MSHSLNTSFMFLHILNTKSLFSACLVTDMKPKSCCLLPFRRIKPDFEKALG